MKRTLSLLSLLLIAVGGTAYCQSDFGKFGKSGMIFSMDMPVKIENKTPYDFHVQLKAVPAASYGGLKLVDTQGLGGKEDVFKLSAHQVVHASLKIVGDTHPTLDVRVEIDPSDKKWPTDLESSFTDLKLSFAHNQDHYEETQGKFGGKEMPICATLIADPMPTVKGSAIFNNWTAFLTIDEKNDTESNRPSTPKVKNPSTDYLHRN